MLAAVILTGSVAFDTSPAGSFAVALKTRHVSKDIFFISLYVCLWTWGSDEHNFYSPSAASLAGCLKLDSRRHLPSVGAALEDFGSLDPPDALGLVLVIIWAA